MREYERGTERVKVGGQGRCRQGGRQVGVVAVVVVAGNHNNNVLGIVVSNNNVL